VTFAVTAVTAVLPLKYLRLVESPLPPWRPITTTAWVKADDFIRKPVEQDDFIKKVKDILSC
jgi:hypothetical protein